MRRIALKNREYADINRIRAKTHGVRKPGVFSVDGTRQKLDVGGLERGQTKKTRVRRARRECRHASLRAAWSVRHSECSEAAHSGVLTPRCPWPWRAAKSTEDCTSRQRAAVDEQKAALTMRVLRCTMRESYARQGLDAGWSQRGNTQQNEGEAWTARAPLRDCARGRPARGPGFMVSTLNMSAMMYSHTHTDP